MEIQAEILAAMAEGVVAHGADGRVERCNGAARRLLGIGSGGGETPFGLLGPGWRAVGENGKPCAGEQLPPLAAFRAGAPCSGTFAVHAPGVDAWLVIESRPVVRDGRAVGVVTVVRDVSRERHLEDALRTAEARWQRDLTERDRIAEELRQRNRYIDTVLEKAPIGFAVHTIDDGIGRFVSARFEEMYGVPRGAIDSHGTFFDKVWRHDAALREQIRTRVVGDMTSGDPSRMHWESIPVPSPGKPTRYIDAVNIPLPEQNLMVSTVQDVTERVRAEDAVKQSEDLYRLLAENVSDLIWVLDLDAHRFRYVSPSVHQLLGYSAFEVVERGWIDEMFDTDSARTTVPGLFQRADAFERNEPVDYTGDVELRRKDGSAVWVEFSGRYVRSERTGHVEVYGVSRDIGERRRAEAERQRLWQELAQSQKMESVGRLAGGIAHDFNNILADMTVQLGLAVARYPEFRAVYEELRADTELAATLIRQLLVFSRRSEVSVRLFDLNEVVDNLVKMLARLLGENVALQFTRSHEPAGVQADAGMLEQVIMNLAINARDAMPQGGRLSIGITHVDVAETERDGKRVPPGRFVRLSVADTGVGMSEETRRRAFEPFFTTKERDRGTGLGLSMVHGIVAQHGGWVEAESAPGHGSRFSVFLPPAAGFADGPGEHVERSVLAGSETVLLVDDFARLRRKLADALRMLGYDVIEAGSGEEAVERWKEHRSRIEVLFSDISLPGGINGFELADRLRESVPTLPVIFSSGYGDDAFDEARAAAGMQFLHKPCGIEAMARAIRSGLAGQ